MSWLFLTRAGSESDLVDELGASHEARVLESGVVAAASRPRGPDGHLVELAFARQALKEVGRCAPEADRISKRLGKAIGRRLPKGDGAPWTWALQVVPPDSSDPVDPRRAVATALDADLPDRLATALPNGARVPDEDAERLVQVWVLQDEVALGITPASQTLSRIAGGRTKLKRPADAVSRSGLKLEEAMLWVGVGPGKGDLCADLGSAPGGWTQVAVKQGATVISVDPAKMKVELPKKRFAHAQMSAFEYVPVETLDWVICDMAWRPLEVAQLLAKWARRVWARQMIANFKLPMEQKAKILKDILRILRKAGWQGLRARQLFHDRDEVTVFGYLDPGRAVLGAQPDFVWRSSGGKKPRDKGATPHGRGGARGGRSDARGRGGARGRSGPRKGARSGPRGRGAPRKRR